MALPLLFFCWPWIRRGTFWGEWKNNVDFNVLFLYVCSIVVFDFRFQGTCLQAQTKPTVSVRQAQNIFARQNLAQRFRWKFWHSWSANCGRIFYCWPLILRLIFAMSKIGKYWSRNTSSLYMQFPIENAHGLTRWYYIAGPGPGLGLGPRTLEHNNTISRRVLQFYTIYLIVYCSFFVNLIYFIRSSWWASVVQTVVSFRTGRVWL